jgi:hypothetical protein
VLGDLVDQHDIRGQAARINASTAAMSAAVDACTAAKSAIGQGA